jgi:hypothetical protein
MMPYPAIKPSKAPIEDFEYIHHDFFLLRIPSFPIDYLKQLDRLRSGGPGEDPLFTSPRFLEALFLGSHELYTQYQKYLKGARYSERITTKLFHGIERYFIRMCSRCTPYGLFAGYKMGQTGLVTMVDVGSQDNYRKHVHLDIHYVSELGRHLQTLPEIRSKILYFPNNSLYKAGDKIRYVESFTSDLARSYRISAVDSSSYIDAVLSRAEGGAIIGDLLACINSEEIGEEEASGFLEALIDNQLLVGDLEPAPSGGNILGDLISKLSFLPADHIVLRTLREVATLLEASEPGIGVYEKIAVLFGEVFPDTPLQNLTYTDLEITADKAFISERVVREIQSNVANLRPLFLLRGNDHLKSWKKSFIEKYEGEEVPLVIALDPELGVGYRDHDENTLTYTPLLDGVSIESKPAAEEIVWSRLLK